MQGFPVAGL